MSDLIKLLEQFNRKERHFLALQLLGKERFQLPADFRQRLSAQMNVKIPSNAFVAIDFHLDWVYAALEVYKKGTTAELFPNKINATIQDIDCLIAFESSNETYHLVFLEAKAYEAWDNDQIKKKAKRLKKIFGCEGNSYSDVHPYFCLISRRKPRRLDTTSWLRWMTKRGDDPYYWVPLNDPSNRLKPTRCNSERTNSENGTHFRIDCVS